MPKKMRENSSASATLLRQAECLSTRAEWWICHRLNICTIIKKILYSKAHNRLMYLSQNGKENLQLCEIGKSLRCTKAPFRGFEKAPVFLRSMSPVISSSKNLSIFNECYQYRKFTTIKFINERTVTLGRFPDGTWVACSPSMAIFYKKKQQQQPHTKAPTFIRFEMSQLLRCFRGHWQNLFSKCMLWKFGYRVRGGRFI